MHLPLATAEFDRAGSHLTVYLSGELDQESAPAMTGSILRHIQPGTEIVWIDLTALTYCGSAGITMFMHIHQHARVQNTRLTLYEPTANVLSVLDMCGVDRLIPVRTGRSRRLTASPVEPARRAG